MNWLGQYERSVVWALVFLVGWLAFASLPPVLRVLAALNAANALYLALTGLAYQRLNAPELRGWARRPSPQLLEKHPWLDFWLLGERTGLSFVLSASVFGFVAAAVFLPLAERFQLSQAQTVLLTALSVLAVVGSWLMAHLAFALHYAHQFYQAERPGLSFPEDPAPDLMDFVYFAFTVGATFASSDVDIISKQMRRTVLKHTPFSFFYNTAIVAMTIQFATT